MNVDIPAQKTQAHVYIPANSPPLRRVRMFLVYGIHKLSLPFISQCVDGRSWLDVRDLFLCEQRAGGFIVDLCYCSIVGVPLNAWSPCGPDLGFSAQIRECECTRVHVTDSSHYGTVDFILNRQNASHLMVGDAVSERM